jgi:ceramide glucosyltransferase
MTIPEAILLIVPGGYQLFALTACIKRLFFREKPSTFTPGISILKPIRGADPAFYEAIQSHADVHYPTASFEILFGVREMTDPAVPHIRKLIAQYPDRHIKLIQVESTMPNGKVAALVDLYRQSTHPVILINDSDIRVPADYLRKVAAPLERPNIGLVTCLYRAAGASFAGWFEGVGIDTDFAPSTLVAPFVGIDEFALGSTIAVRRTDIERIGGLAVLGDYIADDYQLGHRIHGLGLKCYLAEPVVETHLGAETMTDAWQHQVRWARTIRACRGDGYVGLPVTFASFWALVALAAGFTWTAAAILAARMLMALTASLFVLKARTGLWAILLVPLRDLWSCAVWIAGLSGRKVYWRDFAMELDPGGKIVRTAPRH